MLLKANFNRLIPVVDMAKSTNNLAHQILLEVENTLVLLYFMNQSLHNIPIKLKLLLYRIVKMKYILQSNKLIFLNCKIYHSNTFK